MSYVRKDIPDLILAFKSARDYIANDLGTHFLCYALAEIESPVKVKAVQLVRDSLPGCFTLTTWIGQRDEDFDSNDTNLRRLRVLWCDKIISDLKEYAK